MEGLERPRDVVGVLRGDVFVDGKPIINHHKSVKEVPAHTKISDAMSKDLRKRGFKFVGSTICYALMQATGMVNDHLVSCARHKQVRGKGTQPKD